MQGFAKTDTPRHYLCVFWGGGGGACDLATAWGQHCIVSGFLGLCICAAVTACLAGVPPRPRELGVFDAP